MRCPSVSWQLIGYLGSVMSWCRVIAVLAYREAPTGPEQILGSLIEGMEDG